MRYVYWAVTALIGLAVVFVIAAAPIPILDEVGLDEVGAWLAVVTFVAAVIGGGAGGFYGWFAPLFLVYRPREAASEFSQRVVWRGLRAILACALLGFITASVFSMYSGPLVYTLSESVGAILTTRLASIPFTTMLTGALAYWVAIRTRDWGGKHALSPFVRK